MGLVLSRFWRLFATKKDMRILMLGLDAAGKTTMLYRLKLGELVFTIPTIGFNVEQVEFKNLTFTIWDVNGQWGIRPLWRHYFEDTKAVIYVVDSADVERIEEAREALYSVLNAEEMKDVMLLVFANKKDLSNALSTDQLKERLGLQTLRGGNWFIQSSNAKTGEGIIEGFAWLEKSLQDAS